MALPKKKIEKDSAEAIRLRMLNQPADSSTIICKTAQGIPVRMLSNQEVKWPDGKMRPYEPWTEPLDQEDDLHDSLIDGIAEKYVFKWGTELGNIPGENMAQRWRRVKKQNDDGTRMCYAPFAFGEETDNRIHKADQCLYFRERAYEDQLVRMKAAILSPEEYLESREEEVKDQLMVASGGKAKAIKSTYTPVASGAVQYTPEDS